MTTDNINPTDPVKAADIDQLHAAEEHSYDGIEELDNPPPGWIMFIFYLTIGFSILYGAYYFWIGVGPDQHEEYAQAVLKAQGGGEGADAGMFMALLTDEASLGEGKTIWADMNCATCHGPDGGGNAIGPNLTDEFWINGCDFEDIFNIIKNGQPLKGMTPFKTQLSDERIQKVASYVLASLNGTTPAEPKAPQGEKCGE